MVEVQTNLVKVTMTNPDLHVGNLTPPDDHYKPVLYSDKEASKTFNEMNRDIYTHSRPKSFEKRKKTPKAVIAAYIIGLLTIGALILRKLIKH